MMRLLADDLVEMAVVAPIDPATVWRTLRKTTSHRGSSRRGSSHRRRVRRSWRTWKTSSARTPRRTTRRGRWCASTTAASCGWGAGVAARAGGVARQSGPRVRAGRDGRRVRGGGAVSGPAARAGDGAERGADLARFVEVRSDAPYPAADRLVLVYDDLSTHTPAARYAAFDRAPARRVPISGLVHRRVAHERESGIGLPPTRSYVGSVGNQRHPVSLG